ncbi:MAG: hypothetical protein AMS25_04940 [Gemmatimonas sp. SM23_52]|nr:MAG: hypothetical protein AMS25_04940 [Gemmatimonas sp. SM23_52]
MFESRQKTCAPLKRTVGRTCGPLPRAALALVVLLVLQACRPATEQTRIGREEYIDIYVEILRAAEAAPDSFAAADSARAILARREVTQGDLLDFAHQHAEDPEYLANVWVDIETRLRNPEEQDSARAR